MPTLQRIYEEAETESSAEGAHKPGEISEMIIRVIASGRTIGKVNGCTVLNLKGKKICEVKPNTTLKEIIKLIKISLMLEKAEKKQQ